MMVDHPLKVNLGKISPEEYARNIAILANLETIRISQFIPFSLHKLTQGSLSTSSEDLDLDRFDAGYIYVVTSICAWCDGTGTPQIHLGVVDGGAFLRYTIGTAANAEDSVDYVGQLMLKETDVVRARAENAVAGDTFHLYVNGYKVRK